MEKGKVFISSILAYSVEDLRSERLAVREVVEEFPFLHPWAFEAEPASTDDLDKSYLRHVDECDLFVAILGRQVTEPVRSECLRAKRASKPLLVFAKEDEQRSTEVELVLEALGKKYAPFTSADSLKSAVRAAIGETLVSALRAYRSTRLALSPAEQVEKLAEAHAMVRVSAIVPTEYVGDNFYVGKVSSGNVELQKETSQQKLDIPLSRIMEVISTSGREPPCLVISGRLQWITMQQRWRFMPEPLPPDSVLGLGKVSYPQAPHIVEIRQRIGPLGFRDFCWDWGSNLSERLAGGWELFYDDDGRYLQYVVHPSEQLLFVIRPAAKPRSM